MKSSTLKTKLVNTLKRVLEFLTKDKIHILPNLDETLEAVEKEAYHEGLKKGDGLGFIKNKWIASVENRQKAASESVEQEIQTAVEELIAHENDSKRPKEERQQAHEAELAKEKHAAIEQVLQDNGNNKEHRKKVEADLHNSKSELNSEAKKLGGHPVKKDFWNNYWILICCLILIITVEFFPNYIRFTEALSGLFPLITIGFCLAYSTLIAFLCDLTGQYLSRRAFYPALASGLSGIGLIGIVISIGAYVEGGDIPFPMAMAGLNIVFYIVGIILAKRVHRDRHYWKVYDTITVQAMQLDDIDFHNASVQRLIDGIEADYEAEKTKLANSDSGRITAKITVTKKSLSAANTKLKSISEYFEKRKENGLAAIDSAYNKGTHE